MAATLSPYCPFTALPLVPQKGQFMKSILLSMAASLFVLTLGLAPFATVDAHAPDQAQIVEGQHNPILLARMTVTATPLPE